MPCGRVASAPTALALCSLLVTRPLSDCSGSSGKDCDSSLHTAGLGLASHARSCSRLPAWRRGQGPSLPPSPRAGPSRASRSADGAHHQTRRALLHGPLAPTSPTTAARSRRPCARTAARSTTHPAGPPPRDAPRGRGQGQSEGRSRQGAARGQRSEGRLRRQSGGRQVGMCARRVRCSPSRLRSARSPLAWAHSCARRGTSRVGLRGGPA